MTSILKNIYIRRHDYICHDYFNKNNHLYKSQYGFCTLHSAGLASLEIIDITGKDLDTQKLRIVVFLGVFKAFDNIVK